MAKTAAANATAKVSFADFTKRAIVKLRTKNKPDADGNPRLGIHTVYSGFLSAANEYFGYDSATSVQQLKNLETAGVIDMAYAKGGSVIYLKGEMPESRSNSAAKTIADILS